MRGAQQMQPKVNKPSGTPTGTPNRTPTKPGISNGPGLIKSPSDTTLYAPALQRVADRNQVQARKNEPNNNINVNDITKFIEGIRMQTVASTVTPVSEEQRQLPQRTPDRPLSMPSTSRGPGNVDLPPQPEKQVDPAFDQIEVARERARQAVLDAEQFKATVNAPQGKSAAPQPPHFKNQTQCITDNAFFNDGTVREDDEFFHITCHMDANLFAKIERGEYVDLEKLLPRPKGGSNAAEPRSELIFREGRPVIVPHVDKSRTISSVRRWEQAFRVYAAIYSQANPCRSAEIWQYVFVINTAAASYIWNDVAEYDYAFRQMMASNPMRSWSKIYNQMWNICLNEKVVRQGFNNSNFRTSGGHAQNSQQGNSKNGNTKGGKSPGFKNCWRFNKGIDCKYGSNCKYPHRCSFCDVSSHGLNTCPVKTTAATAVAQTSK